MVKNVIKIVILALLFLSITSIIGIDVCYADDMDVIGNPDKWTPIMLDQGKVIDDIVLGIAKIIRTVGILISVITLMSIGIKFLIGTVEEKAQYKQTLFPWLIGAILVFSISILPTLIYNITKGILDN